MHESVIVSMAETASGIEAANENAIVSVIVSETHDEIIGEVTTVRRMTPILMALGKQFVSDVGDTAVRIEVEVILLIDTETNDPQNIVY